MHISTKMKAELFTKVGIPEGVEISLDNSTLTVKGKEGELSREFRLGRLDIEAKGNEIIVGSKKSTKVEKKMMNTIAAHIRNMISGVTEKFVYEAKICSGHFPFTVTKEGNDKAIVKNFLGEKIPRTVSIPKGVDVEIKKEIITIKSMNKELAGQCAANFEMATKIKGRDRRIFQDGVYIINKNGKLM